MTAEEFKRLIEAIGMSAYAAGPILGKSRRHGYRYANGTSPIPETVAKLLRLMAEKTAPKTRKSI